MAGDAHQGVARGRGMVAVGFEFEEAVGAGTQVRCDVNELVTATIQVPTGEARRTMKRLGRERH